MQNPPKLEDRIGRGTFRRTLGALALAGALTLPGCASVQTTASTNGNLPNLKGTWIIKGRENYRIQISQDGDYYWANLIDGLGGAFSPGYKYLYGNVKPDGTISCYVNRNDGVPYHQSKLVDNYEFFCRTSNMPTRVQRSLDDLNSNLCPCGLRVVSVEPALPADKAGVKVGDVIIGVNGERIDPDKIVKDPSRNPLKDWTEMLREYDLKTENGSYKIVKVEGKPAGIRWNYKLCTR